jgi:hypothetical protein
MHNPFVIIGSIKTENDLKNKCPTRDLFKKDYIEFRHVIVYIKTEFHWEVEHIDKDQKE